MAVGDIAQDGLGAVYQGKFASKILLEPMFTSDNIMGNYRIYPNVKYKQNLMLAPKLQGITAVNDACGANTGCTPDGFTIAPKVITVENTSVKQEQCWDEFKSQVIVESYRNGVDMADLSGTELADAIINRTRDGIKHDLVRNMWAGDSGAEVADCSYKSMGDGLWEALSVGTAINGATQLREVTAVSTDAANLIAVGSAIDPADAVLLLQTVFDTAPAELQQVPASEKRIFVTPNIYNAYYGSLTTIATAGAVDYGHSEAQSGVNYERLRYRGVELVAMYEWDEALTALTGADLPPLFTAATEGIQATQGCIYGAKDNFFIGTNVSAPENELKMFYDEVSEKMYIRSAFTMGFQYGWDSLVNGGMLV
tara:strand:+ start:2241 stop:3344 length:1104 start_codon:yes stop_codon:yes gene_type:complete